MPNRRRLIAAGAGALLVAAAAGAVFYVLRPVASPGVIDASGQVRGTEVTVSAKVSGTAEVVPIKEGQPVKRGDLLVKISSKETEARLEQAKAQAAAAESQLREVEAQLAALDSGIEGAKLGVGVIKDTSTHEVHRATEAVQRAEAEVAAAESRRQQDKSTYERYAGLVKEGFVSENYFGEVRARYTSAEARLKAIRQQREEAIAGLQKAKAAAGEVQVKQTDVQRLEREKQRLIALGTTTQNQAEAAAARAKEVEVALADTTVTAPADGTVINKLVEQGELISPGRPLATLIDLSDIYVRVFIAEREIGKIRLGNSARINTDAFPKRFFPGSVIEVSQQAEFTPKEVHMKDEREKLVFGVKVKIDNPEGFLKPGMPVDAKIKWQDQASW
jgi:HlyD family secretion protein